MVDMISIFHTAVCGYTLEYCWYSIDVGTPRAVLEANGNLERIQPFKNFPPAEYGTRLGGVDALPRALIWYPIFIFIEGLTPKNNLRIQKESQVNKISIPSVHSIHSLIIIDIITERQKEKLRIV